jgi:hypothetical protein
MCRNTAKPPVISYSGSCFQGCSVTAAALFDVIEKHICASFKAKSYSAVVGDGGPNVRAAKKLISSTYMWILNICDPCHNLNLFLTDLGKIFKAVSTLNQFAFVLIVSAPKNPNFHVSTFSGLNDGEKIHHQNMRRGAQPVPEVVSSL